MKVRLMIKEKNKQSIFENAEQLKKNIPSL